MVDGSEHSSIVDISVREYVSIVSNEIIRVMGDIRLISLKAAHVYGVSL